MAAPKLATDAPRLIGVAKPRIAPPVPAKSHLPDFRRTSEDLGIRLMPWQETAARYLTATNADGLHLYREVCIVVARQQGKTTLVKPLIVAALRAGEKIMHIAQTRELPRQMFRLIADALSEEPDLFPKRRGKTVWPRYGSGQEEIILENGGYYRIAAAATGSARGWSMDRVIIDELREMESDQVTAEAGPTMTMSSDPQTIYLSNAGHEKSVVLNGLRVRAGKDPSLAYLEWSAAPDLADDDMAGWLQANPAIGHFPQVLKEIERDYRARKLSGTMASFETERLCRWVVTMRERLVNEAAWTACHESADPGKPVRPFLGVAMDPEGQRASAAIAWRLPDERIAVRLLFDVRVDPVNTDEFGRDLRKAANAAHVRNVGFDPRTDAELARHFRVVKPLTGANFAAATSRFVTLVTGGRLAWHDADALSEDLLWTAKKPHEESRSFVAVRSDEDRPITAALAAIRAVWLASEPPAPRPKVH